ncbi:integrator complex subunit 8 [Drosophila gunungcola]|uniref:INTS8 TPR repeats domain-containing protein n=1 Tax=Drosophila gunungcola TaxID=103775 RepID=A0A9Q0BQ44_9MUSC|nr:integrator complex subunit 8 [Drosophila gunungcola]KAI8039679.1 hypothetical protein M5D96_007099 [Drosophila gunungcola]
MDDPLKPKPVPLAAETVLWFEFLLDPHKITQHLLRPHPEPSAMELIMQFISMTPDTAMASVVTPGSDLQVPPGAGPIPGGTPTTPTATGGVGMPHSPQRPASQENGGVGGGGLQLTRKQLALKILELKVATWLKWDLDALEKNLPVIMQLALLRDLCTISYGCTLSIPLPSDFDLKISTTGNERAARFALTIYHRLLLRLQLIKEQALKTPRPPNTMYQTVDQLQQFLDSPTQPSIEYLQQLCSSAKPFYVFHYDSFVTLQCDDLGTGQNYDLMHLITPQELRAQLHYELAQYYLYTKQYVLAREAAAACNSNLQAIPPQTTLYFCHIRAAELEGLLQACGISAQEQTLLEKFQQSLLNSYTDIVPILRLDNRAREIPLVSRRQLELDIEGSLSTGLLKETVQLQLQVAALNVVRNIFEWGSIFGSVEYFEKYRELDCLSPLVEALQEVLPHCSPNEQPALKHFLIDCLLHQGGGQSRPLLQTVRGIGLFSADELQDLDEQMLQAAPPVPTNSLASLSDWMCHSKMNRVDVGALERQLISCTNANTVRILLVKLCGTAPGKPLWAINPSWDVPQPLKTLIMAMPVSFLQDFSYVLLGKARELATRGNYIDAVSMLSVLKSETQRQEMAANVQLMCKLLTWEILHIQITQCLEEWHQKPLDLQALGGRCKQCLGALQAGDSMVPRPDILESCAIMLLNLTEFPPLLYLDKRAGPLELPLAFAATFIEMEKMKGTKKVCRDAWELMLSMFLNVPKRGTAGVGGISSLQAFLQRIRHQSVFGLAISMIGKIHNILKDDPNHDLSCEYMQLWPTSINNPISYSLRSVCEILQWLISEALSYYPQTISWLKMKGDLDLAIGNNESAMRCYVNALVTGTDYCTMPLQRNVADDYVIRKMIRCAANLGCHMQATVLCQFLEEIDYGIVFKNLSEKSSNFTDAMDAYYSCIWDTTLLEFIVNLHAKRGEHSRKLEAISMMGTLELNANNNEEIKRECAMVRKSRFLRALAKQYLL